MKKVVLASALLAASVSAQAGLITTVEAENQFVSTVSDSLDIIDFDEGNVGNISGDYTVYSTPSGTNQSAPPFGITSEYLSIPNPNQNGSATMLLDETYNFFGLFWGSVDDYNSITFYNGDVSDDNNIVASISGDQIDDLLADGNQVSWTSNRFVNFFFTDGDVFDRYVLTSNGYAFESDNHSYGNVSVSVSEPATLTLFGLGLAALGFARRKA